MDIREQRSSNVAQFLPVQADGKPDMPALRVPRRSGGRLSFRDLSFAALDRAVDRRARALVGKGISCGCRVLLMVRPGLDLIVVVFALFKIGAIPIVIDPGMGLRSFLQCVSRSRPEALIAIPLGLAVSRMFPKAFRDVKVRIGASFKGEDSVAGKKAFPACFRSDDDPAAILFTSGSTGPAKGVCYEHGMFDAQVNAIRGHYGIEPGEVDLPMLPVFALFNPALGMTTVVPEINPSRPAAVNPARIVEVIRRCGVTNSFGSPVLWKKIGSYCRERELRLPSLRRVLVAGAPLPSSLVEVFREILPNGEVHSPYGATEALPVSSIAGAEILEETRELTVRGAGTCVGCPLPGVDLAIMEIHEGPVEEIREMKQCPAGKPGEILVRGAMVTREYDALPEATAAAKVRDGGGFWHRMGDVGYLDGRGRLWFCGRVAERVETANGPLYTDCCEAIFNRVPGVFRTALIGIGERGRQVPAVVVEPERGAFPRGRARREAFVSRLCEEGAKSEITKNIKRFFFEKRFPVDVRHNAKIHRLTLAKKYQ